ncbi:MAG TPA: hypothetical protein VG757_10715 [Devosia sp.]|nr:hypothetical protein [Devosia sp.]
MQRSDRQLIALCAAAALFGHPALAADEQDVPVTITVVPTASIAIIGTTNLLYLEIPPAGSTIPASGVNFAITGNANASVTAEPDSFVSIPTFDYPTGESMGRAVLNGNPVGYRLRLDFPAVGPGAASSRLPGYEDGPTTPPLAANLMATGGTRNGRIHLEASPDWTPTGGLPLPGIYVGSVTITVTAF